VRQKLRLEGGGKQDLEAEFKTTGAGGQDREAEVNTTGGGGQDHNKITPRRTDDNYADEAENGPLPLGFNWPCGLLSSAAFGKHFFLSLF
jgi:hypothetical protein